MTDYVLLPAERRALREAKRKGSLSESSIPNVDKLLKYGVVAYNYYDDQDQYGNFVSDGTVSVTDEYERYLSSYCSEWLWRAIPIVISLAALVISLWK